MAVKRLCIRLPRALKTRLLEQVDKDSYGVRGVSQWIREALQVMLDQDPKLDRVGQGDRLEGEHDESLIITVPPTTALLIHDRTIDLRERDLLLEGPQSLLLRSAIRFRLSNAHLPFGKLSFSSPTVRKRGNALDTKVG